MMWRATLFLSLTLFCSSLASSDVIHLTHDNFTSFLEENKYVFVSFYAPWCGHCKKVAPQLEEVATRMKPLGVPVAFLNAIEEKDLAHQYEVSAFPTLLFFYKEGGKQKTETFAVDREVEVFVRWLSKRTQPPPLFHSEEEALSSVNRTGPLVLGFFSSQNEHFDQLSRQGTLFGQVDFATVLVPNQQNEKEEEKEEKKEKKVEGVVKVLLPSSSEAVSVDVSSSSSSSSLEAEELLRFQLLTALYPPLSTMSKDVFAAFEAKKQPFVVVFADLKSTNWPQEKETLLSSLASSSSLLSVGLVDGKAKNKQLLLLGGSGRLPALVVYSYPPRKPVVWETETFTEEKLTELFSSVVQKRHLRSFFKSAVFSPSQSPFIEEATATTFPSLLTSSKPVFVLFYDPECEPCQEAEKMYEEVASEKTDILFARLNLLTNSYPDDLFLTGVPAFYLYLPQQRDTPIQWTASFMDRNKENLLRFLDEHVGRSTFQVPSTEQII